MTRLKGGVGIHWNFAYWPRGNEPEEFVLPLRRPLSEEKENMEIHGVVHVQLPILPSDLVTCTCVFFSDNLSQNSFI